MARTQMPGRETTRSGGIIGTRGGKMNASTPTGDAVPDDVYGVVSVLYHALQGTEAGRKYLEDARRAGDEELVEFFEMNLSEERERARRASSLLGERLEDVGEDEEDDEGDGSAGDEEEDEE